MTSANGTIPFRAVENDYSAYHRLNNAIKQIRYITILPGSGNEGVVCELGYTSLDLDLNQKVKYEALSYCWGDVHDTLGIRLRCPLKEDGILLPATFYEQPYHITKNLHEALRALRYPHETRKLWVDAVCIDQSDPVERTEQVSFMGKIYSGASSVLVWLGAEDFASSVFASAMKSYFARSSLAYGLPYPNHYARPTSDWDRIYEIQEKAYVNFLYGEFPSECMENQQLADHSRDDGGSIPSEMYRMVQHLRGHIRLEASELREQITYSFLYLLSRPWFRRIWVLQEVKLAPSSTEGRTQATIIIGEWSLDWSDFADFAYLIIRCALPKGNATIEAPLRQALEDKASFFVAAWVPVTWRSRSAIDQPMLDGDSDILALLSSTKDFLSSDSRDKLFAILHLAEDTLDQPETDSAIRPDYTKSTEQVILDFACWHISHSNSLRILHLTSAHSQLSESRMMPSWVPDIFNLDEYLPFADSDWYGTAESSSTPFFSTQRSLSVQGTVIRYIDEVLPYEFSRGPWALFVEAPQKKELFSFLLENYHSRHMKYEEPDPLEFCFKCLVMFGVPAYSMDEAFSAWASLLHEHHAVACLPFDDETLERFCNIAETGEGKSNWKDNLVQFIWSLCKDRRIFTNHDGAPGLCSYTAREGDMVVLLDGSKVPFVLRPRQRDDAEADGMFQLIGPCLLYGDQWTGKDILRYQKEFGYGPQMFELV